MLKMKPITRRKSIPMQLAVYDRFNDAFSYYKTLTGGNMQSFCHIILTAGLQRIEQEIEKLEAGQ